MGAGITPAKRQVEPMTCGRARAMDGADIARGKRTDGGLYNTHDRFIYSAIPIGFLFLYLTPVTYSYSAKR